MADPVSYVYADFAGRKRKFELRLGELAELERMRDAGIAAILNRLVSERWFYDDMREPIRLALIGGGESESMAQMLVENYVDKGPKRLHLTLAASIIVAFIDGIDPKDAGETENQGAPATSPPSTAPAP